MIENIANYAKEAKHQSWRDSISGFVSIAKLARLKIIAPKPWDSWKDVRKPGKPCVKCGVWTFMGTSQNIPAHARERWCGNRYLRYCSQEHEC